MTNYRPDEVVGRRLVDQYGGTEPIRFCDLHGDVQKELQLIPEYRKKFLEQDARIIEQHERIEELETELLNSEKDFVKMAEWKNEFQTKFEEACALLRLTLRGDIATAHIDGEVIDFLKRMEEE